MSGQAQSSRGFTLIELLLSIAIMGLIAALSLPVYRNFQSRNSLATTTQHLVEMLRRAETYARGVNQSCQWGVNFQSTAATLFCGNSFAARNSTWDEVVSIPSDVTLTFTGDIVFAQMTGLPSTTLTQTLRAPDNTAQTITVNSKGMVDV